MSLLTLFAFLGGLGGFEVLIVLFFTFIFPIIALVDLLTSSFEGNTKLIWVIVVIFLPFIGSILYFVIGRNQKITISK